ncbi:MAG TPA: PQQ-binding-like beta-propeller repeat protein [Nitrososphaerales archaeon]|nr:PQQ-binding-like beta-propeller repeat protein [Nitrososphaerales archaeon]
MSRSPKSAVGASFLLLLLLSPSAFAASSSSVNWTNDNANPQGTNYVEQTQLNPGTADSMQLAWSLQFPVATLTPGLNATGQGSIAPPLLVDGTVYVVMNDLEVLAINSATGSTVWTFTPVLNRSGLPVARLAGHVHGLTYHDGDIWMSLPDCSALALNAATGAQAMRITGICAGIPGNAGNYDYSGTPVVFYRDLMVWTASSVSEGTDAGRGFVAAYNITTGWLVWRWYVSPPSGGDPNWDSDSCPPPCHGNISPYSGDWGTLGTQDGRSKAGASPGWGQPAVDTGDGLVFVATSQPSPDWNATYRPGPDLYSDSIIALNASTGRMAWFFQTTPHDLYDFDCGWNVALANITVGGRMSTAVLKACKNGYVYALDAKSGGKIWEFDPPTVARLNTGNADYTLTGTYNATEKWVSGAKGYEQCPGINGGVESDISVSGGRLFVATHNFCAFVTAASVSAVGGSVSGASGIQYDFVHSNTTIYALDLATGRSDWSYTLAGIPYRGWLTSTDGLVFASTLGGDIIALDASSGAVDGTTHVGSPLYEGVTIGSDTSGNVLALQLTSAPTYGAFTSAVPGALFAFRPGSAQPSLIPWLLLAAVTGVLTVAALFLHSKSRSSGAK